jgi:hypothetical protein
MSASWYLGWAQMWTENSIVGWAECVLGSVEPGLDRAKYVREYLRAGLNCGCVEWGLNWAKCGLGRT